MNMERLVIAIWMFGFAADDANVWFCVLLLSALLAAAKVDLHDSELKKWILGR